MYTSYLFCGDWCVLVDLGYLLFYVYCLKVLNSLLDVSKKEIQLTFLKGLCG